MADHAEKISLRKRRECPIRSCKKVMINLPRHLRNVHKWTQEKSISALKLTPKEILRSGIKRAAQESSESSSEESESLPPSFSRLFKVGLERKNQGAKERRFASHQRKHNAV